MKLKKTIISGIIMMACAAVFSADLTAASQNTTLVFTGGRSGSIDNYTFELVKASNLRKLLGGDLLTIGISPDGKTVVAGDKKGKIAAWNTGNGSCTLLKTSHLSEVRAVVFSHNGKYFATGGRDRAVKIFSMANMSMVKNLEGHKSYVYGLSFSPDDSMLASVGSDCRLVIWSVSTGAEMKVITNAHYQAVYQVRFSPDGRTIYTSSADGSIKFWNAGRMTVTQNLEVFENEVLDLALSPDGSMIAAAGRDRKIAIVNTRNPKQKYFVQCPDNHYSAGIGFTRDGRYLVMGDKSGALVKIEVQSKKIVSVRKGTPICVLTIR